MIALGPLVGADLPAARAVLAAACAYDDAAAVAEEKLFGDAPGGPVAAFGAVAHGVLVGVAAASGGVVRLVAVVPGARGRGAGTALLAACEAHLQATGAARARVLGLAGNYLAPGVDVRNVETIAWLERRGYAVRGEPVENVLIDVRTNPRVSATTAAAAAAAAGARGYRVRRAAADEAALYGAIAAEFGGAWPFEVARAGAAAHVAIAPDGSYAAFAAHDGNNAGLGWFGPAGTWPAHRGQGLGEAVLLACLVDVAAAHAQCEVAWIGPRAFYDRVAGIAGARRFAMLSKAL